MYRECKTILIQEDADQLRKALAAYEDDSFSVNLPIQLKRGLKIKKTRGDKLVVRRDVWPCHVPLTLPELVCFVNASDDNNSVLTIYVRPSIWFHLVFGFTGFIVFASVAMPLALFWAASGCYAIAHYAWRANRLIRDFSAILPRGTIEVP